MNNEDEVILYNVNYLYAERPDWWWPAWGHAAVRANDTHYYKYIRIVSNDTIGILREHLKDFSDDTIVTSVILNNWNNNESNILEFNLVTYTEMNEEQLFALIKMKRQLKKQESQKEQQISSMKQKSIREAQALLRKEGLL